MKTTKKTLTLLITIIGLFVICSFFKKEQNGLDKIRYAIVIGVDGMSPNGIVNSATPILDNMMKNGAYTLRGRAVLPSSSSSNWASMIMGADTEQHGITSNSWERNKYILPPVVATSKGTFPTIFTLFKDQKPEAKVGAIYDWDGFGRLFEKSDVDFDINGNHEDDTTKKAVAYIKANKPTFTFVHLDHVDHAGHTYGHGSKQYYKSVEKADKLIGNIIQATKDAGTFDKTLFIVAADHGGIGFGHGGETPAEVNIPFIMYGAGVKKGYEIKETFYQYDNAATIAFAFGLQRPQAWIGRPLKGAFEGFEKPVLKYALTDRMTEPIILPTNGHFGVSGGVYVNKQAYLNIQNPNDKGDIYYTLNGTDPTSVESSKRFIINNKVPISKTTVVKAAIFIDGKIRSQIAQGNFRILHSNNGNGVNASIYRKKGMVKVPDFSNLKPIKKIKTHEFSLNEKGFKKIDKNQLAVVYQSYLKIDQSGGYEFFTDSDDGSLLYVDNKLVVINDGAHAVRESSGKINLKKGKHLVKVAYFNGGGGSFLEVKYKGPNIVKQVIPADRLFHL